MRATLIFLSLILLFVKGYTKENDINGQNKDFKKAEIIFSELKSILKHENGKLWNCNLDGPLILINRETRLAIANEPDPKGELEKHGSCYVGYYPKNRIIANTSIEWNSKRWTMVMLPLADTKEERLNLLIHESFHRIQPLIGFDSIYETQSIHLDTKEGRIYLKLELEALKKSFTSEDPEIHIKSALLFRQFRHQIFSIAKQAENSLEINEGLAEYTGSILSQRNSSELQENYLLKIEEFSNLPTFVRSFAYITIPIYGYFMQKSDENWNLKISKNTILSDYISEFFGVKLKNLNIKDIKQLGENYKLESIMEFETRREMKQQEQIRKYKAIFLSDSVVSISLKNMNIGFNPSNIMPLDTLGTVYPNLRVTDNWGILEVDSCGALMNPYWNHITISYPQIITDSLINGKGWRLKLNKSWRMEKFGVRYKLVKK